MNSRLQLRRGTEFMVAKPGIARHLPLPLAATLALVIGASCVQHPKSWLQRPQSSLHASAFEIEQIEHPAAEAFLFDSQHHFRIRVRAGKAPISVPIPVNITRLRGVDIASLHVARFDADKRDFELIGKLEFDEAGAASVPLSRSGVYSLIGLPVESLPRSILKGLCTGGHVPRVCTKIDCAVVLAHWGDRPPGIKVCDLCTREGNELSNPECLLKIPNQVFPAKLGGGGDGREEPDESICAYKMIPTGCAYSPDATTEVLCAEKAAQLDDFYQDDPEGRPCICGTSARHTYWDPVPNGCTDAYVNGYDPPRELSCITHYYNCEVVSD